MRHIQFHDSITLKHYSTEIILLYSFAQNNNDSRLSWLMARFSSGHFHCYSDSSRNHNLMRTYEENYVEQLEVGYN